VWHAVQAAAEWQLAHSLDDALTPAGQRAAEWMTCSSSAGVDFEVAEANAAPEVGSV